MKYPVNNGKRQLLQPSGFKFPAFGVAVFLLLMIIALEATARERKREIYFGLNWVYTTFNSAFDGRTKVVVPEYGTIFAVPKIHATPCYAVTLGAATSAKNALGFAFEVTGFWHKHTNLTWYDWETHFSEWRYEWQDKANIEGFYVDLKVFYTDGPIQPYLLAGMVCHWGFIVDDGFVNPPDCILGGGDSDFSQDYGLRFGAGLNLNVHRRVRLTCNAVRQFTRCDRVRGWACKDGVYGPIVAEIEGGLTGSSTSILVGLQFAVFTRHEGR